MVQSYLPMVVNKQSIINGNIISMLLHITYLHNLMICYLGMYHGKRVTYRLTNIISPEQPPPFNHRRRTKT